MTREQLQNRKDQLFGYVGKAKDLIELLDRMQISGTRADMRQLEALTDEIKRMN